MTTDKNKQTARRLIEAWNRHDAGVFDEIVAADAVLRVSDPNLPRGPEGFKSRLEADIKSFPDRNFAIELEIAEGDLVMQRIHMTGTHTGPWGPRPATGKTISVRGVVGMRFKDGKVIEAWDVFDDLGAMRQLGLYREP